jgi:hypothetical protein
LNQDLNKFGYEKVILMCMRHIWIVTIFTSVRVCSRKRFVVFVNFYPSGVNDFEEII